MDSLSNPTETMLHFDQIPLPLVNGCPLLLTEGELISLLRIPEVTKAKDYHNVVQNLMRMHDLPCIHIGKQPLFPIDAVRRWIIEKAKKERTR